MITVEQVRVLIPGASKAVVNADDPAYFTFSVHGYDGLERPFFRALDAFGLTVTFLRIDYLDAQRITLIIGPKG